MKVLRQYQQKCLEAIWNNLSSHVLVSVDCGGGKSLIIAELCKRALIQYPGTKICIIVPKMELVQQNYDELIEQYAKAPASIYCAGLNQKNINDITIGTIQSLYRAKIEIEYDLIIVDECHLLPKNKDGMFHNFFDKHEEARIIGLTATPYRSSGYLHQGEGALFDKLVYSTSLRTLIKEKHLSKIVSYNGSKSADLTNIHIRAGEYKQDELQTLFIDKNITDSAVSDCIQKAKDRKSILVFCTGIEHSYYVAELFKQAGIGRVEVVTSETTKTDRANYITEFKSGKIRILINCEVYTTGFNAINVDCIILLRATQSPGLYYQMCGRGLRLSQGKKDCLLLDYGSNVERLGTIDSLNIISKGRDKKAKNAWECPECKRLNSYSIFFCECGYERKKVERTTRENILSYSFNGEIIGKDFETVEVKKINVSKHKSKAGNYMAKIEYYDTVFSFGMPIIIDYLYSGHKFNKWTLRHGIRAVNVDELIEQKDDIIIPKKIVINKTEKYKKIEKEIF